MPQQFECDLSPPDADPPFAPRIRFNFNNGWSASLVARVGANGFDAALASLACAPTGGWGKGETELGPNEATADEAIAWLHEISGSPAR